MLFPVQDLLPILAAWFDSELGNRQPEDIGQVDLPGREVDAVEPAWAEGSDVSCCASADVQMGCLDVASAFRMPLVGANFEEITIQK